MEIPSAVEAEPQSLPSPLPFASCFPIFVTIMGRFLGCPVQGHELDFNDSCRSLPTCTFCNNDLWGDHPQD